MYCIVFSLCVQNIMIMIRPLAWVSRPRLIMIGDGAHAEARAVIFKTS